MDRQGPAQVAALAAEPGSLDTALATASKGSSPRILSSAAWARSPVCTRMCRTWYSLRPRPEKRLYSARILASVIGNVAGRKVTDFPVS